jgi:hypothetical protein
MAGHSPLQPSTQRPRPHCKQAHERQLGPNPPGTALAQPPNSRRATWVLSSVIAGILNLPARARDAWTTCIDRALATSITTACGARNVILSLYSYNPVFGLSRRLNSQRLSRPYKVHSAAHQSFQALVKLYSRASGFSFTWSATSRFKSASDSSFSIMFYRSHFSSASRCTANASGFLILNQCEFFGRFWARK